MKNIGICSKCGAEQFLSYGICNYNGTCDGKIISFDAKRALNWWDTLSLEEQFYKVIPWLKSKGMNVTDKHPHNLTFTEIQTIWALDKPI